MTLLAQAMWQTPPVAERTHTNYDPDLGWVGTPNLRLADMYGSGRGLTTNEQGFRNDAPITLVVPDGQLRIVCSGDSFTFGYGVRDGATWCHQLGEKEANWQTVNMGQGGYGLDQAYLWYKRDGTQLEHQVHLVAFITDDFRRMQFRQFMGYDKPLLRVIDDTLVVDNVPVSRRAFYVPWITQNMGAIQSLRSVTLLRQFFPPPPEQPIKVEETSADPALVSQHILRDLNAINQAKGSQLVLVYLPTLGDYGDLAYDTQQWRTLITEFSTSQNIPLLDLIDDFQAIPEEQIYTYYLHEGEFPGAAGHYSERGNEFVAEILHRELLGMQFNDARK